MKSRKALRIIVPLLILVVAAGLWLVKDRGEKRQAEQQLLVAGDPAFVLQETSFNLEAYQSHRLPLILHFGADDCPPCQEMRPALEATHQQTIGKAVIKYFDVWKQPELAGSYPVRVVPTQVFILADGSPYEPSAEVQQSIDFQIYRHRDSGDHALTVHEGMLDEEQFRMILKDMGLAA